MSRFLLAGRTTDGVQFMVASEHLKTHTLNTLFSCNKSHWIMSGSEYAIDNIDSIILQARRVKKLPC